MNEIPSLVSGVNGYRKLGSLWPTMLKIR